MNSYYFALRKEEIFICNAQRNGHFRSLADQVEIELMPRLWRSRTIYPSVEAKCTLGSNSNIRLRGKRKFAVCRIRGVPSLSFVSCALTNSLAFRSTLFCVNFLRMNRSCCSKPYKSKHNTSITFPV